MKKSIVRRQWSCHIVRRHKTLYSKRIQPTKWKMAYEEPTMLPHRTMELANESSKYKDEKTKS